MTIRSARSTAPTEPGGPVQHGGSERRHQRVSTTCRRDDHQHVIPVGRFRHQTGTAPCRSAAFSKARSPGLLSMASTGERVRWSRRPDRKRLPVRAERLRPRLADAESDPVAHDRSQRQQRRRDLGHCHLVVAVGRGARRCLRERTGWPTAGTVNVAASGSTTAGCHLHRGVGELADRLRLRQRQRDRDRGDRRRGGPGVAGPVRFRVICTNSFIAPASGSVLVPEHA